MSVGASGQSLDFTQELAPPAGLASPSLAFTMVSDLEREAAELTSALASTQAPTSNVLAVLTAQANWRLLAAELIATGDRSADAGVASVMGSKLATARKAFDHALVQWLDDGDASDEHRRVSMQAIESFNRAYADHVLRGSRDDVRADKWVSSLLSRLLPAFADHTGAVMRSHWVELAGRDASVVAGNAGTGAALRALRLRAEASPLTQATREQLASIVEFLERGRQIADLAASVESHRRVINGLLDCAETCAAATWLRDEQRDSLMSAMAVTIDQFVNPSERDAAMTQAHRLSAICRVLGAATSLQRSGVDTRTLREVMATLDQELSAVAADDLRAANLAAMSLERMIESRTVTGSGSAGMTRELRAVDRDLQREYRATESKVLRELAAGTLYRGSLADPNLASLLIDHRERVEDLQRLRLMPEWIALFNRLHPPAARDFEAQLRRRAADLLVPTRRPEARQAFNRFDRERVLFEHLPFERSLHATNAAAASLTGGLHAELAARITVLRREWADDWSRAQQTPGPARSLTLMRSLMQALQDSAALIEQQPSVLNRWPMWQMNDAIILAGQRGVETRLQLACAAAVQGDVNTLAEQIDRLERESPLARLAGRLMSTLGHHLLECDAGVAGVLTQLVVQPEGDAAWLHHRDDFARLCRFAAEAAHARDHRNSDAARECDEYVSALATRLLKIIADP